MASIPGFRFDITGASGSQGLLSPKNGWRCYVFPRGAYASQDSTGTVITFDTASVASRFAALNWIQAGTATANIRQVSAVGGNSIAINTAMTVSENQRIFLIGNTEPTVTGGSATYTTPNTIVRQRDDDTADLYTNSMITTNADGLVQGFAATALYDLMIQDGNRANQGALIDAIVGVPEGISVSDWAHFGSTVTMHAALGVTGTATFGSTVTMHAALGVTGTVTTRVGPGLIRYADGFTGSDASARIRSAILSLPSSGGVVDARGLVGSQTFSTDFFSGITNSVRVLLGAGQYTTSVQIIVPGGCQLVGIGVRYRDAIGTQIIAASGFSASTAVIRLGDGSALSFHCRVEDLLIHCNNNADYGLYSTDINERSGARRVSIINFNSRGVWIDGTGSTQPDNYLFDEVDCGFGPSASTPYGFYLNDPGNGGQFRRCTANRNAGSVTGTAGVYVTTADAGGSAVHIFGLNTESYTDGVFFDTNGGGTVVNGALHVGGTSLIRINSNFPVYLANLVRSVGTNIVRNDILSQNLTTLRLVRYSAVASAEGYQVVADVGSNATSGNVVSDSVPLWMIKSTATSGGASRSHLQLRDGNNDGWAAAFEANSARDPFALREITGGTVSSILWQLDDNGAMSLVDGITASAGVSNYATIYVDAADGDLKVRFSDGFVRVIAADS